MSEPATREGRGGRMAALLERSSPTTVARVDVDQLAPITHEMATEHHARLADLFADTGAADGEVTLRTVYALDAEQHYLVLECPITGERFPPLSDLDPAAFVEECEIAERYGIRPDNDKPLNRVLVPPQGTPGVAETERQNGARISEDYQPHVVSGEAFEFPFGPVRAAGWESLYMGLVTTGEEVLDLYLFHWHKHRGVERRVVGCDPTRACFFVQRIDGLSGVGDSLAFCRAVEAATGTEPPAPAVHSRTVALELERIYNHCAAIAAMCQATGLSVGQARMEIVLEQALRANLAAFGHRYLFDVICPGGIAQAPDATAIRAALPPLLSEFRSLVRWLLATNSFVDRLEATGILAEDDVGRLALVGPVARGCGAAVDVRCDHPQGIGDQPAAGVVTATGGDALARMRVLAAEVDESWRLIAAHLDDAGPGLEPVRRGDGVGLGWAESPRGEALAWVALDGEGRIRQARLRPASLRNWRAFDDAARAQNVFTDVPIIEASFWLTVAGFAR